MKKSLKKFSATLLLVGFITPAVPTLAKTIPNQGYTIASYKESNKFWANPDWLAGSIKYNKDLSERVNSGVAEYIRQHYPIASGEKYNHYIIRYTEDFSCFADVSYWEIFIFAEDGVTPRGSVKVIEDGKVLPNFVKFVS